MHIAVDARELEGRRTGVGTYLAHLLNEWSRLPAANAHRWTLYLPDERPQPTAALPKPPGEGGNAAGGGDRVFERRVVSGRASTWWEQGALAAALWRDRPDVLFAPGYTMPLAMRVPAVLTIHDVSFFAHREWFGAREGFRRRVLTRRSARQARWVLTVSEFSKREIVRHLGVPGERVRVILHGASGMPSQPPADPRTPVILYVGSIFNRRRLPDLIRAFASLLSAVPGARLEIVGDNRTRPHEDLDGLARALGVSDRVMVRSYVSGEELEALYRRAAAFAFLSEYEGFALTPLEALSHSVPPVLLDTPVAREVYADSALYVSSGDVAAIRDALVRLLLDGDLRRAQLQKGRAVLARYGWPDAARLTLDALEEAGSRG